MRLSGSSIFLSPPFLFWHRTNENAFSSSFFFFIDGGEVIDPVPPPCKTEEKGKKYQSKFSFFHKTEGETAETFPLSQVPKEKGGGTFVR